MATENLTDLDFSQVIRAAFDETNQCLKTTPAVGTSFAIALAASEGDSSLSVGTTDGTTGGTQKVTRLDSSGRVLTSSDQLSGTSTTVTSSNSVNDIVLAEQACTYIKQFQLYSETLTTVGGTGTFLVELSPLTSGDVWVSSGVSLNASATAGVVVLGTLTSFAAKEFELN